MTLAHVALRDRVNYGLLDGEQVGHKRLDDARSVSRYETEKG